MGAYCERDVNTSSPNVQATSESHSKPCVYVMGFSTPEGAIRCTTILGLTAEDASASIRTVV